MGLAVQGGSVAFYDYADSPQISLEANVDVSAGAVRSSRKATRHGHIAWADIDALIAELSPAAPALPGQYPGVTYLYVESAQIKPQHPDGVAVTTTPVATYTTADVTITYATLPYDTEDLITRKASVSSEFMTLPANSVRWEDQAVGKHVQAEDISAGKLIPLIEHSFTYHRVTTVPYSAIRLRIGHVNFEEFEGAAAETLLFAGAEITWNLAADGTKVYTIDYKFQEKIVIQNGTSYGWNHFWRNTDKTWKKLLDDNGDGMYPTVDFSPLFS